jgi:integrase
VGKWTLADARDRAKDALRDAEKGAKDLAAEKKDQRTAETFGELVAEYIERHAKVRKRIWAEDARIVDVYLKPLKPIRAADVKRADIRKILEATAVDAPIMSNRVLACVRKIYRWGVEKDIVETSPCVGLKPEGIERSRDRVLSDDEIKSLWSALEASPSPIADVYKLRLLTAQRGGEVVGMRWAEVDLDGRWWTIPAERSKNGLTHRVWLSTPVVRMLERARTREVQAEAKRARRQRRDPRPVEHVFPGRSPGAAIIGTKRAKSEIADAAGIDHWTGHDLRRTAASGMASMGIPRVTIARVLNHAEAGITAVYDRHSYDREKKDALDRWAKHIMMTASGLVEVEAPAEAGSTSRRGRGRPRIDPAGPADPLSVQVPLAVHAAIAAEAKRTGRTRSEILREMVLAQLSKD